MKRIRIIANLLFFTSRILAIMFLLVTIYAGSVVLIHLLAPSVNLPLEINDKGYFTIFYPFTKRAFLLGDFTGDFLLTSFLLLICYCIFLWLLSSVFNVFRQTRLFTQRGVTQLSRFYWSNFILPLLFILLLVLLRSDLSDAIVISGLHIIIGIFAFFYVWYFS